MGLSLDPNAPYINQDSDLFRQHEVNKKAAEKQADADAGYPEALARSNPGRVPIPPSTGDPMQQGTPPTPPNVPSSVMASGLRRYVPQFQRRAPPANMPQSAQQFDTDQNGKVDFAEQRAANALSPGSFGGGGTFAAPNAEAAKQISNDRNAAQDQARSMIGAMPPAQGQAFGGGGQGGNWLSRARAASGMGGGGGRRPSPPAMSGGQDNPMFGGGKQPAPLPGPVPNMHAGGNPNFNEAAGSGPGMGAVPLQGQMQPQARPPAPAPGMAASAPPRRQLPPQQVRQQVQSPAALPGMAASASQSPPNPGLSQALRGAPQPRPYQRRQGG